MYAVIASGGKQHRVSQGDRLKLEKLPGSEGDAVTFEDVLLVSNEGTVSVGTPRVAGATVLGKILAHGRGKKIRIYTYKRRKNLSRTAGHRQSYTEVEITGISA